MKISVLIPHYKSGKATAHCVYNLLKNKGKHDINIVVVNNSHNDNSINYLEPFLSAITVVSYPSDKLQSHGIAQDFAIQNGFVKNEVFITVESDSYPTSEKHFDEVERLINEGYDCGGSLLNLSGGQYIHGCGAFYTKSLWDEMKEFCDNIPYVYFPNMGRKKGFDSHLMIHKSILDEVLDNPDDWFELANSYKGLSKKEMLDMAKKYSPTNNPFHLGMGGLQEDVFTYGKRCIDVDPKHILLDNAKKIIFRVGYEPSQAICYYSIAKGKKVAVIPTETKWLPNRVGQQQEYTLMNNGFVHVWAGSSYLDMKGTDFNDVYEHKRNLIEKLYNSIPNQFKI